MADTGLAEAVENAKQEIIAENNKLGVIAKEEPPDDDTSGDTGDENDNQEEDLEDRTVPDEDEFDEASLLEAKNLYKALKDPTSSRAVLAALAEQAGLLGGDNTPTTKREVSAAKKEIKQILKEALPENMQFLADQLGPAIQAVFDQERAENEERFRSVQETQIEAKTTLAMRDLARLTKGESSKLENKMAAIAKEMPPAEGISVDKYLKNLFVLAGGKLPQVGKESSKTSQIQRNATDLTARLKGTGGGPDKPPDKKMSLDESIEFALGQMKKGKRG